MVTIESPGEKSNALMVCENPYPCHFDRGIITTMARRLGMKGWCMGHATDIWGHAQIMSRTAFWGGSFFGGQGMNALVVLWYCR